MQEIRRYDHIEITAPVPDESLIPAGSFRFGDTEITAEGFTEADPKTGAFTGFIRFMPDREGMWQYSCDFGADENVSGSFLCTGAAPGVHGPVRTKDMHFQYDDGTPYKPIGTTIYAWVHQEIGRASCRERV